MSALARFAVCLAAAAAIAASAMTERAPFWDPVHKKAVGACDVRYSGARGAAVDRFAVTERDWRQVLRNKRRIEIDEINTLSQRLCERRERALFVEARCLDLHGRWKTVRNGVTNLCSESK